MPFLQAVFLRSLAHIDAGVVDENVQPPQLPRSLIHHAAAGALIGHICGDGDGAGAELLHGGGILRGVAPADGDFGAGARQALRHAEANAAVAASDQRRLAFQVEA